MHQPLTILLMAHALLSSDFPAQDRVGTQVAGTDAGAHLMQHAGESPAAPQSADAGRFGTGPVPALKDCGAPISRDLSESQVRSARRNLEQVIAFVEAAPRFPSAIATSRALGLNNSS